MPKKAAAIRYVFCIGAAVLVGGMGIVEVALESLPAPKDRTFLKDELLKAIKEGYHPPRESDE